MKRGMNGLLLAGALIPLVLLFWPFLTWGPLAGALLRGISAFSLQALLCRTVKHPAVWAIPPVLTGSFALWGTYLYRTSPHWLHATAADLLGDYLLPFLACAVVLGVYVLRRKKKRHRRI